MRALLLVALALWSGAASADERELDEVLAPLRGPLPSTLGANARPMVGAGRARAQPRPTVEAAAEPRPTVEADAEPRPTVEADAEPRPTVEAPAAPRALVATAPASPSRPLGFADRFGLTGGFSFAPLADAQAGAARSVARAQLSEAAPRIPSTTARLGMRFALLERSEASTSATPSVSLLVRLDDAGRPSSMGLGLETRLGVALVKPVAGFFPVAELYALAAVGGAGLGLRPDEAWVRLGVGLQLNLYTLFGSSADFGAFANGFFSWLGGYYQGFGSLFGGGWGGNCCSGGGSAGVAALFIVVGIIVAALVLPPLVVGAAFLATLAGMAMNVELSWQVTQPGVPPMAELRLGVGF